MLTVLRKDSRDSYGSTFRAQVQLSLPYPIMRSIKKRSEEATKQPFFASDPCHHDEASQVQASSCGEINDGKQINY